MVRPYSDDNIYMIDMSMWVRLLAHGQAAIVPRPLCRFRVSPTSLSAKLAGKQGREARRFFRALAKDYHIARWRLWSGLIRATVMAFARQLVFARQRSR